MYLNRRWGRWWRRLVWLEGWPTRFHLWMLQTYVVIFNYGFANLCLQPSRGWSPILYTKNVPPKFKIRHLHSLPCPVKIWYTLFRTCSAGRMVPFTTVCCPSWSSFERKRTGTNFMECAGDSNTNAEDSAVENIARIANAVQVSKCPSVHCPVSQMSTISQVVEEFLLKVFSKCHCEVMFFSSLWAKSQRCHPGPAGS